MAFNEQEKQIILYGKQNGKSRQEVEEAIVRFRTGNPVTPVAEQKTAQQSGALQKLPGEGIASITGLPGVAKAVAGAVALPFVAKKGEEANMRANEMINQAVKLPIGDPERTRLLKEAMDLSQRVGQVQEQTLSEVPTVKSAIGSTAKLAGTALTAGQAPALTGLGRVGQGVATGAGFGAAQATEDNGTASQIAKGGLLGAIVGGVTSGAIEAGRWAVGKVPKLLSYVSDTPEAVLQRNYDNPSVMAEASKYVKEKGGQTVLADVQGAVRDLRTSLTQQYGEGKNAVVQLNSGKVAILDQKTQTLFNRVAKKFGLEKIPQNMDNVSVKEAIDLNEELNAILRKGKLQESAEGVLLRKASDALERVIKGEGAQFQGVGEFLSNYANEKTTLDAADTLVRAYKTKNPIAQRTALSRLLAVYNENAPSFLSAMKDLEEKTGVPILDKLAALKSSGTDPASSILKSETLVSAFKSIVRTWADNLARLSGRASKSVQKVAPSVSGATSALGGVASGKVSTQQ